LERGHPPGWTVEMEGFVGLFGSQATDQALPYSDYDILIILKNECDWKTEDQILNICYTIDLEYDILTDIKVLSINDLNTLKGKQPFVLKALREGITV